MTNDKAFRKAKENYLKEVEDLALSLHNSISTATTRFVNKAFNLAIKHQKTIQEIKEAEYS